MDYFAKQVTQEGDNMEGKKISVVVPVFNTEDYIQRCVESLMHQQYQNLEILLVNDGSTDNSLNVMNQLAQKYKEVHVIDKPHEGVSAARNAALDVMTGDLVSFVDSDDWLSEETYEVMTDTMDIEQADLVYCDWLYEYSDGTSALHIKDSIQAVLENKKQIIMTWFEGSGINHTRTLFKKELIGDTRFETKYTFGEDILFSFLTVSKANRAVHIPYAFYHRFFRVGSITNVLEFDPRYAGTAFCTDDIVDYVKQELPEYLQPTYIRSFIMYEMLLNRMVYYKVQKEEPKLWQRTCTRLRELYHKVEKMPLAPKMAYLVFRSCPPLYRAVVVFYYKYYKKELDGKSQR